MYDARSLPSGRAMRRFLLPTLGRPDVVAPRFAARGRDRLLGSIRTRFGRMRAAHCLLRTAIIRPAIKIRNPLG